MAAKKKPTRKRRRYSDEDRANALAALSANAGNVQRTARELGLPEKTLANWASGVSHPEAAKDGDQKKGPLADRLEDLAHRIVDVAPGKLGETPLRELMVSLGIAVEKMRLLRDQSTSNDGDGLSDDERSARFADLLDLARARRGAPPRNGPPAEAVAPPAGE